MEKNLEQKIADKVKILSEDQQEKVLEFVDAIEPPRKTLWDLWENHLKEIPQEELDEIPTDASTNLDHYLYGSPKK